MLSGWTSKGIGNARIDVEWVDWVGVKDRYEVGGWLGGVKERYEVGGWLGGG